MNDFYMLQDMDRYITGNYGEDYFADEKSADLYDDLADIKYERRRDEE